MSVEALVAGIPWTFESFPEYLDAVERRRRALNVGAHVRPHAAAALRPGRGGDRTGRHPRPRSARCGASWGRGSTPAPSASPPPVRPPTPGACGQPVPSRLADLSESDASAEPLAERGKRHVRRSTPGPTSASRNSPSCQSTPGGRSPGRRWSRNSQRDVGVCSTWPSARAAARSSRRSPVGRSSPGHPGRSGAARERCRLRRSWPSPTPNGPVYRDPPWRARARPGRGQWGASWDNVTVQETRRARRAPRRPPLGELAAQRGVDPLDVCRDLALADDLATRFRIVMINDDEEQLAALLAKSFACSAFPTPARTPASSATPCFAPTFSSTGSASSACCSLEDAVWRLTGHPAPVFGIAGRGRVAPGGSPIWSPSTRRRWAWAASSASRDLPAGADRLVARSHGLHQVWINGEPVTDDGKDVGTRPGRARSATAGRPPGRTVEPRARGDIMEIPRIISVDDHVIEPAHVWQEYLPARRSARPGPHRSGAGTAALRAASHGVPGDDPNGYWADCWSYADTPFPADRRLRGGQLSPGPGAQQRRALRGHPARLLRPSARLADMDRNHTDASLCFPTFPRSAGRRSSSAATVTSRWPASGPTTTG